MSAVMVWSAMAHPKDKRPDYEAGKKFVEKMSNDELAEATGHLIELGALDPDFHEDLFDDDKNPLLGNIQIWLGGQVSEFEQALGYEETIVIQVRDLIVYIIGGLTHGDPIDGSEAMDIMRHVPGLEQAMNFVDNFHMVDTGPTPEDEAKAIASLTGKSVGS